MPAKQLFFALLLLNGIGAAAQYQTSSSKAVPYRIDTASSFSAFANEWNHFLLFKRIENQEHIYSLFMTDNEDNVVLTSDLRVATTVEDNHFLLAGVALAGRNLTAFVESRNAKTGRNVLAMQAVDNKGGLTSEGMLVGYFDSPEPDNAGAWHIVSTPDQMHIALIAQLPHEQGKADRFQYYFMNENLTITHKGEFSVSSPNQSMVTVDQFLASDQGDLYIVSEGKGDGYPVIYKGRVGSAEAALIPVRVGDASALSAAWRAAVNPNGGLTVVGYLRDKGAADQTCTGTWNFSLEHPEASIINKFVQPVKGMDFKNILFNGGTYFSVALGNTGLQILGFDALGQKKIENTVPINDHKRDGTGLASGILANKLCVVYRENTPVLLSVGNDGTIAKQELKMDSPMVLHPRYFSVTSDRMLILGGDAQGSRSITIR